MKIARGEVRRLLKVLDEIQLLASTAKNGYLNDIAPNRIGRVVPPLDKIAEMCIAERGRFREIKERLEK